MIVTSTAEKSLSVISLGGRVVSQVDNEEYEELWRKKTDEGFFNGDIHVVDSLRIERDLVHISTSIIDYKTYLSSKFSFSKEKFVSLAVSSIIEHPEKQGVFLVGRRSQSVSCANGKLEFVGSGGVDTNCVGAGNVVDPEITLFNELYEEAAIVKSSILDVKFFAIVVNYDDQTCDVCYKVSVAPDVVLRNRSEEYSEISWMTSQDIETGIEMSEFVATSVELSRLWDRVVVG